MNGTVRISSISHLNITIMFTFHNNYVDNFFKTFYLYRISLINVPTVFLNFNFLILISNHISSLQFNRNQLKIFIKKISLIRERELEERTNSLVA